MPHQVRMARADDLEQLVELSTLTGGGLTNLPNDRVALERKIEWSIRSCSSDISQAVNEFYLFVFEEEASGKILGTASIYSRLGAEWPFYSYKLNTLTHFSRSADRHFSTQVLTLVNDFDGASEVGGLFLHPEARSGGFGRLLAKSRYLFIARHRARFADILVAELRGWVEAGRSPFWDAVGRKFFNSEFHDADFHNATMGNQFIADLMPKLPVYTTLLPEDARAAIGRPHADSVPAMAMLQNEGFFYNGYVDIFDAGPTLHARTDLVRSIADSLPSEGGIELMGRDNQRLLASGQGQQFTVRSWSSQG